VADVTNENLFLEGKANVKQFHKRPGQTPGGSIGALIFYAKNDFKIDL
jgi:hypothetical protein